MIRCPHPVLRRLFAAGAAPGRAAARLEPTLSRLAALARDPGDTPWRADRVLERLTRGIDLAGVAERVARVETAAAAAHDNPGGGIASAPAAAPPGRRPEAGGPPAPVARPDRPDVEATSPRPAGLWRGAPPRNGREPRLAQALDARRFARPVAVAGDRASEAAARKARRDSGDGGSRVGPEEATATLRDRAARAGIPTAPDTPLASAGAHGEVATILARVQAQAVRHDPVTATAGPASAPGESGSRDSAGSLARLAGVVERVMASRPARDAAPPRPAPPAPAAERDDGPAPGSASGGLRGLAARAAVPAATVPPVAPVRVAPERAASPLVVERAGEAELARRITRVLRREARRQGIDVGGAEP